MLAWIAVASAASPSCWQGIGAVASATYVRYDWTYAGDAPFHVSVSPDFALECRASADAPFSAWFGVDLHPFLEVRNLQDEGRKNWLAARVGPTLSAGRFDLALQAVIGFPFLGVGTSIKLHPSQRNEAVQLRVAATFPGPTFQTSLLYTFGPKKPAPPAPLED